MEFFFTLENTTEKYFKISVTFMFLNRIIGE